MHLALFGLIAVFVAWQVTSFFLQARPTGATTRPSVDELVPEG